MEPTPREIADAIVTEILSAHVPNTATNYGINRPIQGNASNILANELDRERTKAAASVREEIL